MLLYTLNTSHNLMTDKLKQINFGNRSFQNHCADADRGRGAGRVVGQKWTSADIWARNFSGRSLWKPLNSVRRLDGYLQ